MKRLGKLKDRAESYDSLVHISVVVLLQQQISFEHDTYKHQQNLCKFLRYGVSLSLKEVWGALEWKGMSFLHSMNVCSLGKEIGGGDTGKTGY